MTTWSQAARDLRDRDPILFPSLFVLIVAFYAAYWSRQGLAIEDSGFVLSLSWRIWNGQVPFRDFVYIRPDVSPYLHAVTFAFGNYAVMADRWLTVGQIAVSALATTSVTLGYLRGRDDHALFWSGACCAFVIGAHNFPLYGWHTVDGVFFATLGFFFMDRRRFLLAGVAFMLAGLCKQNFMVVPVFALAATLAVRPRDVVGLALGMVLILLGWLGLLLLHGALAPMAQQIFSGATTVGDVWSAGVLMYLQNMMLPAVWKSAAGALVVGAALSYVAGIRNGLYGGYAAFLTFGVLSFGWSAYVKVQQDPTYHFSVGTFWFSSAAFVVCSLLVLGVVALRVRRAGPAALPEISRAVPTLGMLLTAWSASISWGYPIPAPPVVLVAPIFLVRDRLVAVLGLMVTTAAGLLAFGYALSYAFGESTRVDLLEDVPPELSRAAGMRTSRATAERLRELKMLADKYGKDRLAILPSFPVAYPIVDVNPQAPMDTLTDAEIPPARRATLERDFCRKQLVAAVDMDIFNFMPPGSRFFSTPTRQVLDRWIVKDQTKHFKVLAPPASCEAP
ncbi:MAG: hypothetical protein U1E62_19040 [Alsobacter sp.]